jgi:hypothetical protein
MKSKSSPVPRSRTPATTKSAIDQLTSSVNFMATRGISSRAATVSSVYFSLSCFMEGNPIYDYLAPFGDPGAWWVKNNKKPPSWRSMGFFYPPLLHKKVCDEYLTKKAHTFVRASCCLSWYYRDSNLGHMDFQSIALPTEL